MLSLQNVRGPLCVAELCIADSFLISRTQHKHRLNHSVKHFLINSLLYLMGQLILWWVIIVIVLTGQG